MSSCLFETKKEFVEFLRYATRRDDSLVHKQSELAGGRASDGVNEAQFSVFNILFIASQ